jgi:hypothetical protein
MLLTAASFGRRGTAAEEWAGGRCSRLVGREAARGGGGDPNRGEKWAEAHRKSGFSRR